MLLVESISENVLLVSMTCKPQGLRNQINPKRVTGKCQVELIVKIVVYPRNEKDSACLAIHLLPFNCSCLDGKSCQCY